MDINEIVNEVLRGPIENISRSSYDDFVEENVGFMARSGMKSYIVRRQLGNCCEWCAGLAGTYEYGKEPKAVYQRHDNCSCIVTYINEKGEATDTWSKRTYADQRVARIAREAELNKTKIEDPVGFENKLIKTENLKLAVAGNGVFVNKNDFLARNAKKIKKLEDFSDFVCYMADEKFKIYFDDGLTYDMSPEEYAERIKSSKSFTGGPIRAISCSLGNHPAIASRLASALGVDVLAATADVWVDEDGRMLLNNNQIIAEMWYFADPEEKESYRDEGEWVLFRAEAENEY